MYCKRHGFSFLITPLLLSLSLPVCPHSGPREMTVFLNSMTKIHAPVYNVGSSRSEAVYIMKTKLSLKTNLM